MLARILLVGILALLLVPVLTAAIAVAAPYLAAFIVLVLAIVTVLAFSKKDEDNIS